MSAPREQDDAVLMIIIFLAAAFALAAGGAVVDRASTFTAQTQLHAASAPR